LQFFPTQYHSNYQWWDAITHCNAILLSDFSSNLKPIVRIVDDWTTNRPLGLIFETRTEGGKLLICGADLVTDLEKRPEARQLLFSLENYMDGNSFKPSEEISIEKLRNLFIQ
jgi:hypothetical protein